MDNFVNNQQYCSKKIKNMEESLKSQKDLWVNVPYNDANKILDINRNSNSYKTMCTIIFADSIIKRIEADSICNGRNDSIIYASSDAKIKQIHKQLRQFKNEHEDAKQSKQHFYVGTNYFPRDNLDDVIQKISKLVTYLETKPSNTSNYFWAVIA